MAQTIKATLVQFLLIAFDVHACTMMFASLLSITFYTFSRLPLLSLSLLLITLNASMLFSHLCPGTGHIDYWTVKNITNLHFDSQVCFWMNHCTCTQGSFPAQVERSLECQGWSDASAYVAKKCTIFNKIVICIPNCNTYMQLCCCAISLQHQL